jgi:ATP/maltotriose-dependent transcriptional regulator MalT
VYRAAIAIAEKSAFAGVAGLYRMGCGRIHLEAGDPGVARATCEPIWNRLSTASSTAGAGSLILSAQLLAGALLAMGRVSDAHAVLRTTDSLCGVNELVVEPMFEVPFRLCFASCLLAAGDLAGAQVQTERALALSQLPPEHTYVALSHRMLAEIAFTDGRLAEASSQANEGCAALDGHTRSLGDWRVYATAARCAEETGDRRSARARREQSRSAIQALADSLAGETALLERFRLLPEVLGLASGPNLH